jgi:glutaredoxin
MAQPPVIIYSTPTCHFCHAAKDFFDANKISYTDHNVATDL